jgi:DNA-binding MarR family transcriptional regulator
MEPPDPRQRCAIIMRVTNPAHLESEVFGSTEPTPRISYVIARLERAIRQLINERVKPYGLTTLQYTTLSVLGQRGELSNAQLARRSYMTPQAMGEVIEALEAKGYVVRNPHPNHRRVFPAELTPQGRKVLTRCNATVALMEEEMLRDLTAEQRAGMLDGLISAVRALHAGFPVRSK